MSTKFNENIYFNSFIAITYVYCISPKFYFFHRVFGLNKAGFYLKLGSTQGNKVQWSLNLFGTFF